MSQLLPIILPSSLAVPASVSSQHLSPTDRALGLGLGLGLGPNRSRLGLPIEALVRIAAKTLAMGDATCRSHHRCLVPGFPGPGFGEGISISRFRGVC